MWENQERDYESVFTLMHVRVCARVCADRKLLDPLSTHLTGISSVQSAAVELIHFVSLLLLLLLLFCCPLLFLINDPRSSVIWWLSVHQLNYMRYHRQVKKLFSYLNYISSSRCFLRSNFINDWTLSHMTSTVDLIECQCLLMSKQFINVEHNLCASYFEGSCQTAHTVGFGPRGLCGHAWFWSSWPLSVIKPLWWHFAQVMCYQCTCGCVCH